ncbi:CPBP family intramembrane glutamic endopeptidase [Agreia sp. VKM Ac-1783]|uniref:CPBP family intramembrane glutamic endopeptidase n=1 Tax=Agreia sp. VKM Ac-1783 TaxID=1938889 RepID=UPI001120860B|nr:CPBP family intramembrane glutamic endopeptidase [Agreia sp. VKM Ac-1783]
MTTAPVASTPPAAPTSPASSPGSPRLGLGPLGIAVRVVVAIGILMIANLVAGLLPAAILLIPGTTEIVEGSSPWVFALAFVLQAIVLCLVVLCVWLWMRWVERAPIRAAGWRWGRRSILWLLLGVVIAAGSAFAVVALLPATGPVLDDSQLPGGQEATPLMIVLLIAYYLGLAFLQQGIPEELLFRGMLLWSLRERPVLAVVVTTLAFTVIHLVSSGGQQSAAEHVLYLALPFGFALLAVGLLLCTGSLWAAVGVHGGFHVGNYLAVAFLHQVEPVASWLVIGGVQAALGLVLVVTALRRGKRILDGQS